MPSFIVQNLIDRAAALSDMHDQFVKPEQWVAWYNTERVALELFIAKRGATARNITLTTVTPVSGTSLFIGSALAIVGVWEILSNARLRPVRIVNFVDNFSQQGPGPQFGPAQIVSVVQNNGSTSESYSFRFFPTPSSGSYLIGTIPAPEVLLDGNGMLNLPMGIEERIVLGMARRALIKEESDTTEILKLIKEQDDIIEEYVYGQMMAQNPSVRNVDALQRGWWSDIRSIDPNSWFWL